MVWIAGQAGNDGTVSLTMSVTRDAGQAGNDVGKRHPRRRPRVWIADQVGNDRQSGLA